MVRFRVAVHGQAAVTSAQVRRRNEENTPLLAKLMSELGECRLNESLLVEDIQRLTTQMATWDRYVANIGVVSRLNFALSNVAHFSIFSKETEHDAAPKMKSVFAKLCRWSMESAVVVGPGLTQSHGSRPAH